MNTFANILCEEDGTTAVEYAVMLGFIIVVCFAVVAQIGQTTKNFFQSGANSFWGATSSTTSS